MPGERATSHLAMACGLLSVGTSTIVGVPHSPSVTRMAAILTAFGAVVENVARNDWRIQGTGIGSVLQPAGPVDVADDDLTMAIAVGVACSLARATTFISRIPGVTSVRQSDFLASLRTFCGRTGATLEASRDPALPGFVVKGAADALPFTVEVPTASPLLKTAALFAALNAPGRSTIIERAGTSETAESMLAAFGAPLEVAPEGDFGRRLTLTGQTDLAPRTVRLPADPQLTTIAMVLAVLVPGSAIMIEAVPRQLLTQPVPAHLIRMGADLRFHNFQVEGGVEVADLNVRHVPLRATDLRHAPPHLALQDLLLLLVAAGTAEGESRSGDQGALEDLLLCVARGEAGMADGAALEAACAGLPRLLEDMGLLAPQG